MGNLNAKKVGALRSAPLGAVSGMDIRAIVSTLLEQARAGDVQAPRRCC